MLLACVALSMGVTSCNQDEFENYEPGAKREFTKAELIEQALNRLPRTRVNGNGVMMITIKDSVYIKVRATEEMTITWGDHSTPDSTIDNVECERPHVYTDGYPSHAIYLSGSSEALQSLVIDNQELILLEIYSNENLTTLSCKNNHLDELDLTGCPKLEYLYIANNEISSLEVTHLSSLFHLYAEKNQLKVIDVSKNQKLFVLSLGNNRITNLDISKNQSLATLDVKNNLINNLKVANSLNMVTLHVGFNPITELDLSGSLSLMDIDLENIPIETLNNYPISDTSFARYPMLWQLNVAYTSFDSLDLSNNPILQDIDISGSTITQLNISELGVQRLKATNSKLTDLICESTDLLDLYELRVEHTPLEKDSTKISALCTVLPGRSVTNPGHLYTYSRYINEFFDIVSLKNWLINQ